MTGLETILAAVAPLFALVFVGYFAGRRGVLDEAGSRALNVFVYYFAIPPVLFRLMARAALTEVAEWNVVLAYLTAELALFVLVMSVARIAFGFRLAEQAIQAMGSTFSNGVFLGLPLALTLFGEAGAVPALLVLTADNFFLFVLVVVLLEAARSGAATGAAHALAKTARAIAVNPVVLASVGGLVYGAAGLTLAGPVDAAVTLLGQGATPCALFALGATLAHQRLAGSVAPTSAMIGAKLVLLPLLVLALTVHVFPVGEPAATVIVLYAALPTGATVYVLARQYDAQVAAASSSILASTALSLVTVTLLLALLGPAADVTQ